MQRELPEGWEWKKLNDVGEFISGVTYKSKEASDSPSDKYIPILRANNINREINFDDLVYVPIDRVKDKQLIRENDILIAMSSGSKNIVGKSAQSNHDFYGAFGAFCGVFRCNEGLNKKYVGYFFKSSNYRNIIRHLSRGANINNLRRDNIKSLNIPIPPLITQHKIVSVLEKAEETKRLRAQADELAQKLIQSVFLEMFGDPISNPKGWNIAQLKDVCKLNTGGTPSRKTAHFFEGDIPWITTVSLGKRHIYENDAIEYITNDAVKNSATKIIPPGSIMIGTRVGVGKTAINCCEMCTNQDIVSLLDINQMLDKDFLLHTLCYFNPYFEEQMRGATIKGITTSLLKNIDIISPPLYLQQQFADFVQSIEDMKSNQVKSAETMDTLSNALMQKAFTGELVK